MSVFNVRGTPPRLCELKETAGLSGAGLVI